jgi:hypothetical protein
VQLFREDSPRMISQPIALYLKSENRGRKTSVNWALGKMYILCTWLGAGKYSKFKGTVPRDFSLHGFIHESSSPKQCCGSGTVGTVTFCPSGNGTVN